MSFSVALGVAALLFLAAGMSKNIFQLTVTISAAILGVLSIFVMHIYSSGVPSYQAPPKGAEIACATENGAEVDLLVNGKFYRMPMGKYADEVRRAMSGDQQLETSNDEEGPMLHAKPQQQRAVKARQPAATEYVRPD